MRRRYRRHMRPNFGDSLPPWAASAALAVGVAIVLVPILSYLTKRQAEAATPPEQEGTLGDPVNAKAQANFGPLLFLPDPQPNNPEAIRITNGWDQNNITYIKPPGFNRTIPWNKKCVSQLNDLFSAWSGAGLIPQIIQWNGSWNPRFVRGQRKYLSNHTFATAFDINAQWNPMGVAAAGPGEYGNVQDLAAIATAQVGVGAEITPQASKTACTSSGCPVERAWQLTAARRTIRPWTSDHLDRGFWAAS